MKDAEQNARGGKCTRVNVYPHSPVDLNPGETKGVWAQLLLNGRSGHAKVVRWTATPAKGSIAPTATDGEHPDFRITGAGPGPQTASVTFRAVSPAGISEDVWTGEEALPEVLVARLSGVETTAVAPITHTWSGTAPHGAPARPRVAGGGAATSFQSLDVTSFTATVDAGDCIGTATFSGTPATAGGGADLLTAADGTTTYRLNLGWTKVEGLSMTWAGMDCPAATPYGASGHAFTNDPGPALPTTSRPYAAFPFDDSFTATDSAWTPVPPRPPTWRSAASVLSR